ncbi:MAG: cystathionine gamma-synthase [Rhodothermaceae bacterium]|nr:MAG: cystathionine gamma-synthase [Rhodothermaceae bacterium]
MPGFPSSLPAAPVRALLALLCLPVLPAFAQAPDAARTLVHVLDYMAQDYPEAVEAGVIVNADEYAEMEEFALTARRLLDALVQEGHLPADSALYGASTRLATLVATKADPEAVARTARELRAGVIRHVGLPVAPARWPDPAAGAALYAERCAACHGDRGDGNGPAAAGLEPAPTPFATGARVASLSPFQAYNTIRLGVEGTAMAPYPDLTDEQVWALAFFVKSMKAAREHPGAAATAGLAALRAHVTLEQVASLNDADLAAVLAEAGVADPPRAVAALRTAPPPTRQDALSRAGQLLDEALAAFLKGDPGTARGLAVRAYLEGVEPVEPSLRANAPALTARLERQMMAVRNTLQASAPAGEARAAVAEAHAVLAEARDVLDRRPSSPWFAFFMAASILLREGLEAFLIILAILSVLRAAGQRHAARWVHAGWLAAVGVGVLAWFFSDLVIRFGATQREAMEGGIALLAVGVLLYAGFWLHSKTEIHRWKAFIETRIQTALQGSNLFGLAAIAFMAVFREAFESVLFLSALTLQEGPGSKAAVAGGAVLAIAGVLVLAFIALRASARLPVRTLFKYSSLAMGVLSVILAGKAIHAFQETGWLSVTPSPLPWRADLLGLFPTIETLIAQLLIATVVVLIYTLPRLHRPASRTA